jgi:hypothetical protein
MTNLLTKIYHSLPMAKELHAIKHEQIRQSRLLDLQSRRVATSAVLCAMEALKAGNERYRDAKRLLAHGAQYWSQNLEDGMISEVFRRIGTTSKTFLEIGVGDGSENNTTALLSAGWNGWWIEGSQESCAAITARLKAMPATAARLNLRQALVSRENIQQLLIELKIPDEVDFFSLDIDLNTYHIWAALKNFRPRLVVVEYNAGIPPEQSWIHPYEPDKVWDITQDQGASLKAYEQLGREFGYRLVGCDLSGLNAFFVRDDLVGEKFVAPFTAENHYEPPRYGLSYRFGLPSKFYGESEGSRPGR